MEIKKVTLTKENLILIKNIDKLFYKEDILTLDWYLERYTEKHLGYLLFENNKCVGYLVAVPIKEELYHAIINAVVTNDLYFNPKMFVEESNYFYISSTVILEEYRGKGYGTRLLNSLLNDLSNKQICAITVSEIGFRLLKNNMELVEKIIGNNCIFKK